MPNVVAVVETAKDLALHTTVEMLKQLSMWSTSVPLPQHGRRCAVLVHRCFGDEALTKLPPLKWHRRVLWFCGRYGSRVASPSTRRTYGDEMEATSQRGPSSGRCPRSDLAGATES